jgi:hypothetical protein
MHDLSMFRALEQSRKAIQEEFHPTQPPHLASEVVGGAMPKRLRHPQPQTGRVGKKALL